MNFRENSYSLFAIRGSNSHLELNDCLLKSIISNQNQSNTIYSNEETKQSKDIHDVCFFIKAQQEKTPAFLTIKSCGISNFSSNIDAFKFSNIKIYKSFFSNNKINGIYASNPMNIKIKESRFEKCEKSCINIRFSKDIYTKTCKRGIIIKNNTFNNHSDHGIAIYSENLVHQNVILKINQNKISEIQKNAICLKNLNISEIEANHNRIFNISESGIFLTNVVDLNKYNQICLISNKINDCKGFGIQITDSQAKIEDCVIFRNYLGGIRFFGKEIINSKQDYDFYKENPLRNVISNCEIYQNKKFGLGIFGQLKGPLILKKINLYENCNGLNINESEGYILKKNKKKIETLGQIYLENNKIYMNKSCGVYLSSLKSQAFIIETTIKENQEEAVILVKQNDKKFIHFKDAELGKLREKVSGFIGGSWGELFEEKGGFCKGGRCIIF